MAAIFLSAACSPACPPQIWAATAPAIKSDDFYLTHKLNISLPSKFRRKNSTIKCDGLNKTGLKEIVYYSKRPIGLFFHALSHETIKNFIANAL